MNGNPYEENHSERTRVEEENDFCEETRQQVGPMADYGSDEAPLATHANKNTAISKKPRATPPPIPKR